MLDETLTAEQLAIWRGLDSPAKIQAFLDSIQYPSGNENRSIASIFRERQGHCLDGALFGAAALRQLGYPPLIIDLLPEPGADDDHILAIYRVGGAYGAVAKSNYVGLRSREPVYRTLRELVMSYFDFYFSLYGDKTLRYYTRPVNLAAYDHLGWAWSDAGVDAVEQRLKRLHRIPLISAEQAARLTRIDPLTERAMMLGTNPEGIFRPVEK